MLVKIKSWDKMAEKYGLDEGGDIYRADKDFYFSKNMKDICGTEVELDDYNGSSKSVLGKYDGFYIEKWMVKKNGK